MGLKWCYKSNHAADNICVLLLLHLFRLPVKFEWDVHVCDVKSFHSTILGEHVMQKVISSFVLVPTGHTKSCALS